ncbi:Delta(12)-fatty-acid desaturase [Rosistilla carotiformis]|uniref:Delta(12)-fatty-acid desaturase n=1 Tax=Rosistilla carotiformis TaxID=2528017 RepID=A0A518JY02_9BACT|nr:fatty acid desaturase [Rosistilla carotiformis]QDV70415.1 Delta(12)-fatty-acid desaturase [Rosistilla carotiformis]
MSIVMEPQDASSGLQRASDDSQTLPTRKQVLAAIPEDCFDRSTLKSSLYMVASIVMTVGCGVLAYLFMPMTWAWLPAWIAYAAVTGTIATGCWVVAHECGHRAFSKHNWYQDLVGFTLHSALLVPYFSWQRSHALHHARTNHMDLGETFVPTRDTTAAGKAWIRWQETMGDEAFAVVIMVARLLVGWPAYLLTGASGGPARGMTNHFWPAKPFSAAMFPGKWRAKVWLSDLGVLATLGLLGWWAYAEGSFLPVLAVFVGPYLFTNAWLVLYTWLQHTDVDVPHFEEDEWTWVKGAFMTIDRPYGPVFDFLHHRIGSTHVAHHIDARIPHYNAVRATEALKSTFPDLYLYDPTPIHKALWKVATHCNVVSKADVGWKFNGKTRV